MIQKPISDPPACIPDIRALQDTLDILGGKWRMLLIHYFIKREKELNSFKKIQLDMDGISAKVLSQELKILEMNNIIAKEPIDSKPITMRYTITEYGKEVQPIIQALVDWGNKHRSHLLAKD